VFFEAQGLRWLRTGDVVRMDEEGYFHFYDARKDLIKYRAIRSSRKTSRTCSTAIRRSRPPR